MNAEALERESLGIITEINVRKTLKKMIGADFRNYGSAAVLKSVITGVLSSQAE